ncbi:MAG: histidine kinase [Actinomycetota bacterium]|nr:histidine kinase [Actinomycetota bacterium]
MHRRHEALVDAAVPVLVGAVITVGVFLHGGHSARLAPVALGLGAAAVLWGRRRWPAWTLAVSGALVAVLFHVDPAAGTVAVLAPAVALYSLALTRGRRSRLLAGLAAVAAVLIADLLHSGRPGIVQTLGHVLLAAIPLLAAEAIRAHRSNLALLMERLELSEQARAQEADRRAEHERIRIARELHDVVAHTLTEINVQAGAAAERADDGEAREALERIEQASHGAIGELRSILGVLRDPEHPESPRAPAPGIQNIAELVERAVQSGLDVRFKVTGAEPAVLSDGPSLAAYRIVQESLTNARRHAPGAPVQISLNFNAGELSLAIENGRGAGSNGSSSPVGVGIVGMRERAITIGGTLQAGPIPDGFRVHAELPYEPHR